MRTRRLVDARRRLDVHHGDQRRSSGNGELHRNIEEKWKTKKQLATSSCASTYDGDPRHFPDKTYQSVVVVEPRTDTVTSSDWALAGRHAELSDSARTAAATSERSRRTENHEESRGFEAALHYFRQRCAGQEDAARRKVKSEGQQHPVIFKLLFVVQTSGQSTVIHLTKGCIATANGR